LLDELENHKLKLLKISRFSEKELEFMKRTVFKKIELIDWVLTTVGNELRKN
jgi:hypothetical protein